MLTTLANGEVVRVAKTPLPVEPGDLVGRREGDVVIGWRHTGFLHRGFRRPRLARRFFMVRKGSDGNLWLVSIRKPGWA